MNTRELEGHIRTLATVDESEAPFVNCYLELGNGAPDFQGILHERIQTLRRAIPARSLDCFEAAFGRIVSFLETGVAPWARGVAVFARGGERPFFLPLQFRVPLPTWIAVGSTPNIYHLMELRDNYDRYVILLATEESARIIGVNLGSISEQIWKARPELRSRIGHEWTKDHFQDHRRERTNQFLNDQIRTLERVMAEGGYAHLILAGNLRILAMVRKGLPKHLASKLIDTVPASAGDRVSDVVSATLQSFLEHEELESQAIAERLVAQIRTHGLAVAGTRATMGALKSGEADVLVMVKGYDPGSGWECRRCGSIHFTLPGLSLCPACQLGFLRHLDIREEMVRLAGQLECPVEIVEHSDILLSLGGVGCLLRYLAPANYVHHAA